VCAKYVFIRRDRREDSTIDDSFETKMVSFKCTGGEAFSLVVPVLEHGERGHDQVWAWDTAGFQG